MSSKIEGFFENCWSQTKLAMPLKLELFSLVDSNASPEAIGPCECAKGIGGEGGGVLTLVF